MLSQEEYVRVACQCPNCGQSRVCLNNPRNRGLTVVEAEAECLACGATWVEYYTLSGYKDLNVPAEEE